MYCKPCLEVLRILDIGLRDKESFSHQETAEAVCKSYKQGCDICGRLWNQLMNHPDRPFGDRRWYALSTACHLERAKDQVETMPGRDISDPYTQELHSSGLGYGLGFSWKGLGQSRIHVPPAIKFHLLAAQSRNSPMIYSPFRIG